MIISYTRYFGSVLPFITVCFNAGSGFQKFDLHEIYRMFAEDPIYGATEKADIISERRKGCLSNFRRDTGRN